MRAWRPPSDDAAVQSLIGEMVMLAGIVILVTSMSVVYFQGDPPAPEIHADVAAFVSCGDGAWGGGDEAFALVHRGGERLLPAETTVTLTVAGTPMAWSGSDLDGLFADGLGAGERWTRGGLSLAAGAEIAYQVTVVPEGGGGQVLAEESVTDRRC